MNTDDGKSVHSKRWTKLYARMKAKGITRQTVWSHYNDKELIARFAAWQLAQTEERLAEERKRAEKAEG